MCAPARRSPPGPDVRRRPRGRQRSVRTSNPLCPLRVRRVTGVIETSPSPVDVVLPCLEEAEALPWVPERIPPGRHGIVVDNGSTDGSADIARALGAYVVHEPRRRFGGACPVSGTAIRTADATATGPQPRPVH